MNILCLGCSFTAERWIGGTETNSWVRELAKLNPEHSFYNCGYSGAGLLHAIWTMKNFLSQKTVDKIIFQIPNSGRFTYYSNLSHTYNVDDYLVKLENNYYWLELGLDKVHPVNYGIIDSDWPRNSYEERPLWQDMKTFGKEYYSRFTAEQHFDLEHEIQVEYIKNRSSFCFYHKTGDLSDKFYNIELLMGSDVFHNNFCDDGCHLNDYGLKQEASCLNKLIFEKG